MSLMHLASFSNKCKNYVNTINIENQHRKLYPFIEFQLIIVMLIQNSNSYDLDPKLLKMSQIIFCSNQFFSSFYAKRDNIIHRYSLVMLKGPCGCEQMNSVTLV